jgi:hypothetical protein
MQYIWFPSTLRKNELSPSTGWLNFVYVVTLVTLKKEAVHSSEAPERTKYATLCKNPNMTIIWTTSAVKIWNTAEIMYYNIIYCKGSTGVSYVSAARKIKYCITYVYAHAVQWEHFGRRGLLRHVAVELFVSKVPLDRIQCLILQFVVTGKLGHFARRNCFWYIDLHWAQPADTCRQQIAEMNCFQRRSE